MYWLKLDQPDGPETPIARSSHSLTHSSAGLVLFGGEHDPRTPISSDAYLYDTKSASWRVIKADALAPCARLAHTAASFASDLYVFGGRDGKELGENALGDLHKLDIVTGSWSGPIADVKGKAPQPRSFHASCEERSLGQFFIFGGCGAEGRLSDLHSFDPRSHTWTLHPAHEEIKGRGGASLVATDQRVHVLGGFCGHELADCFVYDIRAGKWETSPSFAFGRSVFGSASLNLPSGPSIVSFGGEVDPSDKGHEGAGEFTADLVVLQIQDGAQWTKVEAIVTDSQLPCPRGWFACASTDAGLIVHGGLDCGNERLGDLFILNCT